MTQDGRLDPQEMELLDALGEGITIHDTDGRIIGANQAAREILRLEASELTSRNYKSPDWDITDVEGRPLEPRDLPAARAIEHGLAVWDERIVVARPDADPVVLSVNAVPIRDESGRVEMAVISFRDVTDQQEAERRFLRLFRDSPVGIALVSPEGKPIEVNQALADMLGYERSELKGMSFPGFTHPEDVEKDVELFEKVISGEIDDYQIEKRYLTGSGDVVWADLRIAALRSTGDAPTHAVGFVRDITERKRAERQVELSERRYRELFEYNVAGAFRARPDGAIEECNPAFARIFGYDSPRELEGRDAASLYPSREARDEYVGRLREAGELVNEELRLLRRDGTPIWVLENSFLTEDPETGETVIQGTLVDITERKQAEQQLRHQALHDPLTGLANRALLSDRVEQGLARARRHDTSLGLLMVDVDHFKRVNDRLGHAAGDRVLTELARRLRDAVRDEDTVARWGGDEFVVVLPELDGVETIGDVRKRIRKTIRPPVQAGGERVQVDVSVGAVVRSDPEDRGTVATDDPEELIRFGSLALHDAKEESPAGFRVFDPGEEVAGAAQIRRERELRDALEQGEIVPHFQPIVRLEDRSLAGLEVLARWRHPERGLLPPAEFIPLAGELGLIAGIDEAVVRAGCREIAGREEPDDGGTSIPVSFNLSGRQFKDPELVDRLGRWVEEAGLRRDRVVLEVTETSLLQAPVRIEEIREQGFRVYVDDFGTGYSTFTYLRDVRLDGLKVDLTFVQGIAEDDSDAALVETMLTLGDRLGLTVIAEGIESEAQAARLRELGCELGQGFLFARPVPGEELPATGLPAAED